MEVSGNQEHQKKEETQMKRMLSLVLALLMVVALFAG